MEDTILELLARGGASGIIAIVFYFIFREQSKQAESSQEKHIKQVEVLLASHEAERQEWRKSNERSTEVLSLALRGVEKAINDMNTTTILLSSKIENVDCLNFRRARS